MNRDTVTATPIDLSAAGLEPRGEIHRNLPAPALLEHAVCRHEGILVRSGAFRTTTGDHTGRTPSAKATVDEPEVHEEIWWGEVNRPIDPGTFERMHERVAAHLSGRDLWVFDGYAGADPSHRLNVRVVNENAWHNLFARNLFLRPDFEDLEGYEPEFTILHAPSLEADPEVDGTPDSAFVLLSYSKRLVLIGGTAYAGEMKKSIFTVMNYRMPERGVLPMHCSANVGEEGDVALFFGLSGTGKTTLSADPGRSLIGDDEHGWSADGVFNFEGGSYAKTIHLSKKKEPLIWEAIRFGTVLENVVVDERRRVDYDDDAITENTRAGYPVQHIPGAVIPGVGGHPRNVMFLTADAFGVLPPIAKLTPEQAMYHFLSGYTAKVAGTEAGVDEPMATFSACFGAPFLPLHPSRYAEMLGERIERHDATVWLVNTGWTGGPFGTGHRMELDHTRAMVREALDGRLDDASFTPHPIFGVFVPDHVPGVPDSVLDPRDTWDDPDAYDRKAAELARRFRENVESFGEVPEEIVAAGPAG